ncbi:MAG: acyltransferase family protein [Clostridiales bacterium]|nr:acyltransferase family protein [Clostridiales bacterium]
MSENTQVTLTGSSAQKLPVGKNFDAVDIGKFILSILVCCIHSLGGIHDGLAPVSKIAVPMFFAFSGFFFFRKWNKNPSFKETYIPFVKRNLILYIVWLIILLPITMYTYRFFKDGIVHGILLITVRFFFGGLFASSWYIMACVIGTGIVCIVSKKLNNYVLLGVGGVIYIICVLISNYRGLFNTEGPFLQLFVYIYPGTFYHSFPASILFLSVGKVIAEYGWKMNVRLWGLLSVFSIGLMFAEYYLIEFIGCKVDNDCYFTLIPAGIFITLFLLSIDRPVKHSRYFRGLSTLNYVMHGSVINTLMILTNYIQVERGSAVWYSIRFFATEFICIAVGLIILYLEYNRKVKVLKYLH